MREIYFNRLTVFILGVFVIVLSGCASSSPSRFYQLSSVSGQTTMAQDVSRQGSEVVVIGPLHIPDYLDRPQIVTRTGQNELKLSEFDRWAGAIENDIALTLAEDISAKLPQDRFFVVHWTPLIEKQLPTSYKVALFITRFDGTLGGSVTLLAQWSIFGKENKFLLKKESTITEKASGNGYDELVEAMSKAVDRLSVAIANSIASFPKGTGQIGQ